MVVATLLALVELLVSSEPKPFLMMIEMTLANPIGFLIAKWLAAPDIFIVSMYIPHVLLAMLLFTIVVRAQGSERLHRFHVVLVATTALTAANCLIVRILFSAFGRMFAN